MASRFSHLKFAGLASGLLASTWVSHASPDQGSECRDLWQLRKDLAIDAGSSDRLVSIGNIRGVDMYKLKSSDPTIQGVFRVGTITINAPAAKVAETFFGYDKRQTWDSVNTKEASIVEEYHTSFGVERMARILANQRAWGIPARDFLFLSRELTPVRTPHCLQGKICADLLI